MLVAGVDEAGRGPLAGPVVAAAVILDPERRIGGLRDSKLLTPPVREKLAVVIRARAVAWAVAESGVAEIDALNILQATLLAMRRAIATSAEQKLVRIVPRYRVPSSLRGRRESRHAAERLRRAFQWRPSPRFRARAMTICWICVVPS